MNVSHLHVASSPVAQVATALGNKRPPKYRAVIKYAMLNEPNKCETFTAFGGTYATAAANAMKLFVKETGLVHHALGSPHGIFLTIDWNPARAELWS
jgi:hypothetical protein